jgi:predicted DNA-binding transcriptional regulator AlpA
MHTKREVSRWLSKAEVVARYGITQRTLERWLKDERFPAADLRLPGGQPRWSDTAIEAHERAAVTKS